MTKRTVTVTRRQAEILGLMRLGMGRVLIARQTGLHPLTVYTHQKAMTRKGVITAGTIHGRRRQIVAGIRTVTEASDRRDVWDANEKRRRAAHTEARRHHELARPGDYAGATQAGMDAWDREDLAIRRERDARRRGV